MSDLPPPPSPNVVPSAGAQPPPPNVVPSAGAQPPPPMVQASSVTKSFGDVVAVSDVGFSVGPGVTSLLGPNGAGKSTLFRMLCGLTPPTRGQVRILGVDPRSHRDVRGRIGLAPQQDALFDRFTALDFVELAGLTHGIDHPRDRARAALGAVALPADDRKKVGAYSKGMRQRVKLAAALVNDPSVLILDEPLSGLDPIQRRRMIELFVGLGEQGKCLLVSSHVLDEVARLGSNVLVIAQGRLVAAGDYRALRAQMDDRPLRVRVEVSEPRVLAAALIERSLATGVKVAPAALTLDTDDIDTFGRMVAGLARELGLRINGLEPMDDDLESVFRYLVERR